MQAQQDDERAGQLHQNWLIRQERPSERRRRVAQHQKDRGQPQDEKQCRDRRAALAGLQPADLHPSHIGKIRRHDRQHARRQERQQLGQHRDQRGGRKVASAIRSIMAAPCRKATGRESPGPVSGHAFVTGACDEHGSAAEQPPGAPLRLGPVQAGSGSRRRVRARSALRPLPCRRLRTGIRLCSRLRCRCGSRFGARHMGPDLRRGFPRSRGSAAASATSGVTCPDRLIGRLDDGRAFGGLQFGRVPGRGAPAVSASTATCVGSTSADEDRRERLRDRERDRERLDPDSSARSRILQPMPRLRPGPLSRCRPRRTIRRVVIEPRRSRRAIHPAADNSDGAPADIVVFVLGFGPADICLGLVPFGIVEGGVVLCLDVVRHIFVVDLAVRLAFTDTTLDAAWARCASRS